MLSKSLALFLVGTLNILVGLLVITRDKKRASNTGFFGLSLFVGVWAIGIGGFLLARQDHYALALAKSYYFAPLMLTLSFAYFALTFPDHKLSKKNIFWLVMPFLLVATPLIAVRKFLTVAVAHHSWGKEVILNRPEYLLYSVCIISYFVFGFMIIYRRSITERSIYANQARLFFYGYLISSLFGVWFNLFLPWFGNYRLIWIGPLASNAYVIATAYAIARHKMFDVQFFVVRAAAYATTLFLLSALYLLPAIFIIAHFVHVQIKPSTFVLLTFASLIVTIGYSVLRQWFDRLTNKLFFRGYYEPQDVLNRLSDLLVRSIHTEHIKNGSAKILQNALRTKYFEYFLFFEGNARAQKWIDTLFAGSALSKVIVTDEIEDNSQVVEELRNNNIAALVRLHAAGNDLGIIALGHKESGQIYSPQDRRLLSIAADEIAISLQNAIHFQEIQNFNITLQSRVDEATKQLRRTNAKLEALDETKDDFISMASHQLRTPLTSVKGYLSMVIDEDAGTITPMQRKMLNQAFISSQRMVYLIADLLNVSRLKTGKFVIEPQNTNLAEIVREEVSQLKETAASRNITLSTEVDPDFPIVQLDETKIRQVIMNFIDNAIYYTKDGGSIVVKLINKPSTVELRVVDNGIGVPKAEQHHLFTKFYRAANARQARPDGTGLGLFMAKKVVAAQNGAIIFESREGKGSTFGFTFAKSKVISPAKPLEPTLKK